MNAKEFIENVSKNIKEEKTPEEVIKEMVTSSIDIYRDMDLFLKEIEDHDTKMRLAEIRNKLMKVISTGRDVVGY